MVSDHLPVLPIVPPPCQYVACWMEGSAGDCETCRHNQTVRH